MATLIIAYNDRNIADRAIAALRDEGFGDAHVRILSGVTAKLVGEISDCGFEETNARAYAKAVGDGKAVVVADVPEDQSDRAQSILDGVTSGTGPDSGGAVPIVEEEFSVGKVQTTNGGIRVTSSVRETPVEATVTLRTETVGAERRDANRPLEGDEAETAFKEKTIEMMGTREEAEVHKEAPVVGEVELRKEASERQTTVKDTVRKTHVEVERIGDRAARK
ncbi:YsnF/AvaK domain-containing protein [Cereibacter azotoformans]|uniref:YsnF/AvaK domain-containing protein n=1 Tax=Cereibacter azotoformans TaxID=43057 RepID=UPI001F4870D5|nr:YsnF/AvaK domain-containing protein [Cereibacter azotoformans]